MPKDEHVLRAQVHRHLREIKEAVLEAESAIIDGPDYERARKKCAQIQQAIGAALLRLSEIRALSLETLDPATRSSVIDLASMTVMTPEKAWEGVLAAAKSQSIDTSAVLKLMLKGARQRLLEATSKGQNS